MGGTSERREVSRADSTARTYPYGTWVPKYSTRTMVKHVRAASRGRDHVARKMRSLIVALSLVACASSASAAVASSRASSASRPAVLPRSALRLRGGEDADEAADGGAPSSLHEQMRDPAVVQQAMKMMQNPMIMEQMKTMMADPTVKARMQKM